MEEEEEEEDDDENDDDDDDERMINGKRNQNKISYFMSMLVRLLSLA